MSSIQNTVKVNPKCRLENLKSLSTLVKWSLQKILVFALLKISTEKLIIDDAKSKLSHKTGKELARSWMTEIKIPT